MYKTKMMPHPPPSLEDAIGLPAILALRDWLLTTYPVDSPPAPANDAAVSKFDYAWANPLPTLDEPRFYAEPYMKGKREWWRVMDRLSGKVALLGMRQGRMPVKQDMFVSWDEACKRAVELIHMYKR